MEKSGLGHVAGVDVGGTFTDLVLVDQPAGRVRLAKVPSTTDNQAFGVLAAFDEAGADLSTIDLIVHGTTTTTNAVLERKLCRTGLITTRGFRDILELGRRTRPQAYGMKGEFRPIIPRDLRLEADERMDASGAIVTPLDEDSVIDAGHALLKAGCEALVVHFLHAYANPSHELRAAELLRSFWPNSHITLGHALLAESREFERGVTAAVNASVQPLLERYLAKLGEELAKRGYDREILVMNGNGGMVSARLVSAEAAKTVMSGPASGVMAAAYTGRRAGAANLITYDMGGTSTDVGLIRDGQPSVSSEIEIEYAMPIHVPMVDVRSVGAGGGSIARVNEAGLLQVGPDSAGASPGPICYGKGGAEPTISDANFLLGRLDRNKIKSVAGNDGAQEMRSIFEAKLADRLGLDAIGAAAAVLRVANAKMAGAIRMVSVSLGVDPRDFMLFAFGGAGPLHAAALARELGVPKVMVPSRPGITNALGCVVADLRHDFVRTLNRPLERVDADEVHAVFAEQIADGENLLGRERIEIDTVRHIFSVDMQFLGQSHLLRVPLETATPSIGDLQQLFEKTYFERFRVELVDIRASLVNINTSIIGQRADLDLSMLIDPQGRRRTLKEAMTGRREVYFAGDGEGDGGGWRATPIYWRDYLPAIFTLAGPAIVEQMDTTILIEPGNVAEADADGNLIIAIGDRP